MMNSKENEGCKRKEKELLKIKQRGKTWHIFQSLSTFSTFSKADLQAFAKAGRREERDSVFL